MEVGPHQGVAPVRGALGIPALAVRAGHAPPARHPGAHPQAGGGGRAGQRRQVDLRAVRGDPAPAGDRDQQGAARADLVGLPVHQHGRRFVPGGVDQQRRAQDLPAEDGPRPRLQRGPVPREAERGEVVGQVPGEDVAHDLGHVQFEEVVLQFLDVGARVPLGDLAVAGAPEVARAHEVGVGGHRLHVEDRVLAPGDAVGGEQRPVVVQRPRHGRGHAGIVVAHGCLPV
nr:hypothetical protein GCM10020093_003030 [Planobispora longispora]